MARLSVDVPDSILAEEKAKELQTARRRIKTLERQVADLRKTHEEAKTAIKSYRNFRSIVADSLDLFEDYDW